MLIGDSGKYYGMVAGVFFAALIITQQLSIFTGLMSRTTGFLVDTGLPDLWIMDQKVQFVDDTKPLQDTKLLQVRGVEGVEWAVPLYKGQIRARLQNGTFQTCNVIGIDDSTLIGGPATMLVGTVADLRRADGVIVDQAGATGRLAKTLADGSKEPLKIGDSIELNDRRGVVVGIASVTRTFQSQPVIYTTYTRATTFAPRERKLLTFILGKVKPGYDPQVVKSNIADRTRLRAYTNDEFKDATLRYFVKNTGIPINFGIAVLLGFIVGTAIAGQTFASFTTDNLKYFGTLKAMGASNWLLTGMIVLQASFVGILGYGLGVGMASFTRLISANSELAFRFPWQLLVISATAVTLICIISAIFSMRKVIKLEPAVVFKG